MAKKSVYFSVSCLLLVGILFSLARCGVAPSQTVDKNKLKLNQGGSQNTVAACLASLQGEMCEMICAEPLEYCTGFVDGASFQTSACNDCLGAVDIKTQACNRGIALAHVAAMTVTCH